MRKYGVKSPKVIKHNVLEEMFATPRNIHNLQISKLEILSAEQKIQGSEAPKKRRKRGTPIVSKFAKFGDVEISLNQVLDNTPDFKKCKPNFDKNAIDFELMKRERKYTGENRKKLSKHQSGMRSQTIFRKLPKLPTINSVKKTSSPTEPGETNPIRDDSSSKKIDKKFPNIQVGIKLKHEIKRGKSRKSNYLKRAGQLRAKFGSRDKKQSRNNSNRYERTGNNGKINLQFLRQMNRKQNFSKRNILKSKKNSKESTRDDSQPQKIIQITDSNKNIQKENSIQNTDFQNRNLRNKRRGKQNNFEKNKRTEYSSKHNFYSRDKKENGHTKGQTHFENEDLRKIAFKNETKKVKANRNRNQRANRALPLINPAKIFKSTSPDPATFLNGNKGEGVPRGLKHHHQSAANRLGIDSAITASYNQDSDISKKHHFEREKQWEDVLSLERFVLFEFLGVDTPLPEQSALGYYYVRNEGVYFARSKENHPKTGKKINNLTSERTMEDLLNLDLKPANHPFLAIRDFDLTCPENDEQICFFAIPKRCRFSLGKILETFDFGLDSIYTTPILLNVLSRFISLEQTQIGANPLSNSDFGEGVFISLDFEATYLEKSGPLSDQLFLDYSLCKHSDSVTRLQKGLRQLFAVFALNLILGSKFSLIQKQEISDFLDLIIAFKENPSNPKLDTNLQNPQYFLCLDKVSLCLLKLLKKLWISKDIVSLLNLKDFFSRPDYGLKSEAVFGIDVRQLFACVIDSQMNASVGTEISEIGGKREGIRNNYFNLIF